MPFVSVAAASFMRAIRGQALPPVICITVNRIVREEYWDNRCDRIERTGRLCAKHIAGFKFAEEKSHNSKPNGCTPTFVDRKEDESYKHSK